MDLPSIDLNLLVALHALLRERNVTRAGEAIGLSQPAMSAALGRLRRHFGDDLLMRDGQRYNLTPLAASLLDQTEVALRYVESTFAARPVFSAGTSEREFTVVMSDYAVSVLGRPLFALLEQRAPRVRLRIRPTDRATVDDAAATLRGIDLMVMPRGFIADLPSADLYRDRWVVLCAADNPLVGDTLQVDDLSRLGWIVSYDAPTQYTPADKHLDIAGITRDVGVVMDNFLALPSVLIGSRRVAILQKRLADQWTVHGGLRILELPIRVPELIEAIWWHPSRRTDPAHRWLQQLFLEAATLLGPLTPTTGDDSNDDDPAGFPS
ncbi:LysR family transcriptional regulator [Nakamurella sp.]|uniref:LysR family transcriptional regulator n=1 Tax=Nakamurella sp. TaxID=1869182 RepID=UPI003B3BA740